MGYAVSEDDKKKIQISYIYCEDNKNQILCIYYKDNKNQTFFKTKSKEKKKYCY